MVSQLQMWARRSDSAGSEPRVTALLQKKRALFIFKWRGQWALGGTATGLLGVQAWSCPMSGYGTFRDNQPHLAKAQKRAGTYESHSKELEPSLLNHNLVLPLSLPTFSTLCYL